MKKFMKYVGLAIISALILSLAACGSDKSSGSSSKGSSDFPNKAITLISPTSAGGGTDAAARALAADVEKHLGQPVGVVNKPGGSGSVGMTEGANAKPDGYTVTMVIAELTMLEHMGVSSLNQDQMKAVAMINLDPAALTVPADAPYDTLDGFIDYAKAHPGELKVGNAGSGSIWHVAAESLAKNADIELNHVPFEGAAPAVTALVGGHIDAVTVSPAEVKTQLDAGNLKTLAVMSDKRSDIIPDVPTFAEAGLESETIATWRGITVPKDTPNEIVSILEDAFLKAAEEENFKKFMSSNGLGIELKDSKEFTSFMDENYNYYKGMFAELGLSGK
ncbi:tripartite tricarboxylate transporter substrate binding protein [Sporosarcina sp. USHLN248]|uniref:tripartite tricarboxylate transporter substrate binding protein n=1 Tax=Sporosarcina sp. USHLN248 TaxID=3081300 RepID=UPI0030195AC8